ncbi:MAG: haloacid dehalogenase-like hydrolase [Cyclobacteriaceae bacterium]|nr:haloacid dehalogenase-like hydrolase [Cyclobacteriaceae bacterium]
MSEKSQQRLVLFDFDGTLTRYDSLFSFLRFFRGNLYFVTKMLLALPTLIKNKLRLVDNSTAKEKLVSQFLKGVSLDEMSDRCEEFGRDIIPLILNAKIVEKFHQHLSKGDRVIIVSASIYDWIIPWASQWNVEVLATKLDLKEGVITGKFNGENCNGEEKALRIKAHLELSDYNDIWAYGDSHGDEAMMKLANQVVKIGAVKT